MTDCFFVFLDTVFYIKSHHTHVNKKGPLQHFCFMCNNFPVGLNHPVLCVEPSIEMLHYAEKRDGLIPFLGTADEFLANDDPKLKHYNKILINESAHLFPSPLDTFKKIAAYLPEDGKLVVIARAQASTFPMWESMRRTFTVVKIESFKEMLEKAGFTVKLVQESYAIPMTKKEWYDKLRRRIFSTLYSFSDEEIEEGLKELDRNWFPDTTDLDIVDIKDTMVFYNATK